MGSRIENSDEIQSAVAGLAGTKLWAARRTSDVIAFQFGDKRQLKNFRGKLVQVGRYALHLQCPWRIGDKNHILVGSGDLYYPADLSMEKAPNDFDWATGPNRCDELLRLFFADNTREFQVNSVEAGSAGSLNITFDRDLCLSVLPTDSLSNEHWRIFRPGSQEDHFVVSGQGVRL